MNQIDHDPFQTEILLPEAIAFALKKQDPREFRAWMYYRLPKLMDRRFHEQILGSTPLAQYQFCLNFGRYLWDTIPFPDNHFQPMPMPTPRDLDPCWCASELTFRACCGRPTSTPRPQLPPEVLYSFVLLELPEKKLKDSNIQQLLPFRSIVGAAVEFTQKREFRKVVALLEPHFQNTLLVLDEVGGYALNLLYDALDALGHSSKKMRILVHAADCQPGSFLSMAALQILAALELQLGNNTRAWEIFGLLKGTDTGGVDTAGLEIHMLLSERRFEEAKDRARFWLKKLPPLHPEADQSQGIFALLQDIAQDPQEAAGAKAGIQGGEAMSLFGRLIARLRNQPLPTYELIEYGGYTTEPPPDMRTQFERQLRAMGVAEEQISTVATEMEARVHELAAAQPDDEDELEEDNERHEPEPLTYALSPHPELLKLEKQWDFVFRPPKPSLTAVTAMGELDPWEPEIMRAWVSFLEQHPGMFDDFTVLDDLLNALSMHPDFGVPWFDEGFSQPLMNRVVGILQNTVGGKDPVPEVPWVDLDNRPALRCLFRAMLAARESGDTKEALRLMRWLLKLNPRDNHGVRALAINLLLQEGNNEEVLEITEPYWEGDHMADVVYGRVLALYRLGRMEEAREALGEAKAALPLIPKYLLARQPKKPKLSPYGISMGGEDQAWLYREEMLEVWKKTPGVLEWMKKLT